MNAEDVERGAIALIHAPLTHGPFGVDELSGVFAWEELEDFSSTVLAAVLPEYRKRVLREAADDLRLLGPHAATQKWLGADE